MQAISIKRLTTDAAEVILSNLCQEVIFWSFGNEYEGNFTTTEHLHCDRRRSRHYNEQKQKFLITYEVYLTHKIILFSPSFSLFHLLWSFFFFFKICHYWERHSDASGTIRKQQSMRQPWKRQK